MGTNCGTEERKKLLSFNFHSYRSSACNLHFRTRIFATIFFLSKRSHSRDTRISISHRDTWHRCFPFQFHIYFHLVLILCSPFWLSAPTVSSSILCLFFVIAELNPTSLSFHFIFIRFFLHIYLHQLNGSIVAMNCRNRKDIVAWKSWQLNYVAPQIDSLAVERRS